VVSLEDVDAAAVKILLAWAFTGSVESSGDYIAYDVEKDYEPEEEDAEHELFSKHVNQLIDCYILGERLLVVDFKNAIIDLFIQAVRRLYDYAMSYRGTIVHFVRKVYLNTPEESPLRRVLVGTICAENIEIKKLYSPLDDFATGKCYEDFLLEVINVAVPTCTGKMAHDIIEEPWKREICGFYHEHPGQPKGYSCRPLKKVDKPRHNTFDDLL
jgi:hypothetical protein